MCEQCQRIEEKIRRARRFVAASMDNLTIERLNQLIEDLQRSKDALQCGK